MSNHHTRSTRAVTLACAAPVLIVAVSDLALAGGAPPSEAGRTQEAQPAGAGAPPFDLSDPKKIEAGKSTFNSTCAAYCHGQNPTLFVGRSGLNEEYVYSTIRDGGKGATPMPPWGEVFSHEEIWELVAYLKSLGKW